MSFARPRHDGNLFGMRKHSESCGEKVAAALADCRRVVLLTHRRPDGDALGSVAALCLALRERGVEAFASVEPDDARAPAAFVLEGLPCCAPAQAVLEAWDAVVVLDAAAPDRLPEAAWPLLRHPRLLNIDHHAGNPAFGVLNWVDPGACATGELIARLLLPAPGRMALNTAEALWVALVTDTGRFSHANTTAAALRTAAALLEAAPVRTDRIAARLYGNLPLRVLRLRQRALAALDTWHDGQVGATRLAPCDFEQTGCRSADVEDIIELPRALAGARAAVLLYAPEPADTTRLSLRSSAPLDAAAFCARFGGGGHARAAGCTLDLPLDAAWERVRRETKSWLDNG